MAPPLSLGAREYKLLLDRKKMSHIVSEAEANEFMRDFLGPAIKKQSDLKIDKKKFKLKYRRTIRFFDTHDCTLTKKGFALRTRSSDEEGDEITLKLRTPDLFVVASTPLPGAEKGVKPFFEEDISPLEVLAGGRVALARPPSMRSRFSLSTSQTLDRSMETWQDVTALYPGLDDVLDGGAPAGADELLGGVEIGELVFKGPTIDFGDDIAATLTLTIWRFPPRGKVRIAEISFKCKFADGFMPRGAAIAASRLFVGIQKRLAKLIDLEETSKTALAVPAACSKA